MSKNQVYASLIQIPDDQLCIATPLTPWIECRKSVSISKSLGIDNYLTGIRMREFRLPAEQMDWIRLRA